MLERFLSRDEIEMVQKDGFNARGLRYEVSELNKISPHDKSIKEMAEYVDAVTYIMVKKMKNELLMSQLHELKEGEQINVSITGLGNLAFTALNCTDPMVREKAFKIYHQITNGAK